MIIPLLRACGEFDDFAVVSINCDVMRYLTPRTGVHAMIVGGIFMPPKAFSTITAPIPY